MQNAGRGGRIGRRFFLRTQLLGLVLQRRRGLFKRRLRGLERLARMFHRLSGKFVRGQMIFLAMMRRRSAMSVRGEFMKFRRALMRIVGHDCRLQVRMRRVTQRSSQFRPRSSQTRPLNQHRNTVAPSIRFLADKSKRDPSLRSG